MGKREEVMLQREAFCAGANFRYHEMSAPGGYGLSAVAEAEKRYPLTETRPRVMTLANSMRYRFVDGELQFELNDGRWMKSSTYALEQMHLYEQLAELKANPTEEVPL